MADEQELLRRARLVSEVTTDAELRALVRKLAGKLEASAQVEAGVAGVLAHIGIEDIDDDRYCDQWTVGAHVAYRDVRTRLTNLIPAPSRTTGRRVTTVEELDALAPGAIVVDGSDEVYRRLPNGQFRCLDTATGYREWDTESARTALWQNTSGGPGAFVVFEPKEQS